MKIWIASLSLAIAAVVNAPAHAATYYLADCAAGAAATCIPGSAANDGLSAAKPKQLWSQLPPIKGGDRILFAKGGAWNNASMRVFVATTTPANPVIWDSYNPPWGGIAKPILAEPRTEYSVFNFDDGGQKIADGGYEIRNLDLRGGGVMGVSVGGKNGVFAYWNIRHLLMENLEISGFKLGVQMAQNPKAANGWENQRVVLRNSYVHDNSFVSFLGGAAELVIENNVLDRNGTAAIFDHDIYISSVRNAVIRNNTITRSVLNANGQCTGSVIVVHGFAEGLAIENNLIDQSSGGSTPHCYGIEVSGGYTDTSGSEYFHDVTIRGNTVVNVGYVGIGARGCTRCVIENNSIVWTSSNGNQGISTSMNNPSPLDERGTALTIRNNSIYMQTANDATGILMVNEGTEHVVRSNLIYFGSAGTGTARCFDTKDNPPTSFKTIDANLCFRASGPLVYSPAYPTLASAQSAGFDRNGLNVNPLFRAAPAADNGYSLKLSPNSPAAGIGTLHRGPVGVGDL